MLLVTSAFGHMQKQIIPSMVNQLESALSVSIGREREVSQVTYFLRLSCLLIMEWGPRVIRCLTKS